MTLGDTRTQYTETAIALCKELKHSIELLEMMAQMDKYVILLEEFVENLSDPEENPWN